MLKLIEAASPDMLPYVVIQAFAGLREKEIQRMDWEDIEDIDLVEKFIQESGQ